MSSQGSRWSLASWRGALPGAALPGLARPGIIGWLLACLFAVLLLSGTARALDVPPLQGRVNDRAGVLSPAERDFPFEGAVQLRSLEGKTVVETDAAQARARYLAALAESQAQARQELLPRGGRLLTCATTDSPELLVRRILSLGMEPSA